MATCNAPLLLALLQWPLSQKMLTCRRHIDYGQSSFATATDTDTCRYRCRCRYRYIRHRPECGRNRLSGRYYAISGQKRSQAKPAVLFTQSEVSHSNLRRLVAKVRSWSWSWSPSAADAAHSCSKLWMLDIGCWMLVRQSGRQLHPLQLISSLLHSAKYIAMTFDPLSEVTTKVWQKFQYLVPPAKREWCEIWTNYYFLSEQNAGHLSRSLRLNRDSPTV